jgi:xanthine dehydrogenase accessory factor
MPSLFDALAQLEKKGVTATLCTIIRARGSVPRHVGSRLLVYPDGRIEGTIGGGEMESRVIREALTALNEGAARIVRYELVDPKSGDPGVCGGEVEIFVWS